VNSPAPKLEKSWLELLNPAFQTQSFQSLKLFLTQEKQQGKLFYPPNSQIFRAFELCPVDHVKVVILGQDPYHGPGQAHGLSFSVPQGQELPPSLQNIFKEVESDLKIKVQPGGNLESWARQGVLLLNTCLTVEANKAGSHAGRGWEPFTDRAIQSLAEKRQGLVFMLWGKYALNKKNLIPPNKHLILTAPHPSPLSAYRGFFGCRHFSRANAYLAQQKVHLINWADH